MRRLIFKLLITLYVIIFSNSVAAHAQLLIDSNTPPRTDAANIKTGPCGNIPRTGKPALFPVNAQQVEIQWKETIDHPGYYTIKFSTQNDDFDSFGTVLVDRYDDLQDDRNTPHFYSTLVNLPNTQCRECTLQLVQAMTERTPPNDKYFSCADIALYDPTDTLAPNDVGGLLAEESETGIQLSWVNPGNDFYKVLILQSTTPIADQPANHTVFTAGDMLGAATVAYNGVDSTALITNIEADTYYYFKVLTYDDNYNYSSGQEAFIQTRPQPDTQAPENVTNLTAGKVETGVLLNWINPSSDFSQTMVLQDTAAITDVPAGQTMYQVGENVGSAAIIYIGSDPTFIGTEVTDGGTYHFKVIAFDASNNYSSGESISFEVNDSDPVPEPSDINSQPPTEDNGGSLFWMVILLMPIAVLKRTRQG